METKDYLGQHSDSLWNLATVEHRAEKAHKAQNPLYGFYLPIQ